MTIAIITLEDLRAFTHPALDLQAGQFVELAAEPAPEQLELFTEVDQREALDRALSPNGDPAPGIIMTAPNAVSTRQLFASENHVQA